MEMAFSINCELVFVVQIDWNIARTIREFQRERETAKEDRVKQTNKEKHDFFFTNKFNGKSA